jgi:hypothetical protein
MALFSAAFATDEDFNIRAIEGGDAAEVVSRLSNEVAAAIAAGEGAIIDFNLAGAGSGLKWEAWFIVATGDATPDPIPLPDVRFVAAEAGNPTEAVFYLKQRIAAIVPTPLSVYKIEVAGAGDGPTYMAVALVLVAPQ